MKHESIKTIYVKKAVPMLIEQFGHTNTFAIPKIQKVVVNAGLGRFLKEPKRIEEIVASLETITGQKVVLVKARKAVAGFKIRENQEIGVRVTLRGERMWSFLDRFVKTAMPRVRDLQGITVSSVDSHGNLNAGLKEHMVFPEIVAEKVQTIFGFQVNVTTTAKNHEEGVALFRSLGFPLQNKEVN
ncbi:MAG: 50S ribosomal protein L5 [Candidatus Moranbacteria bacterium]|nr:50S ribosomal protein L5 [Candidatus Moranbacteria bacterium]